MNDQKTALYRHYDAEGRLLYVGISLSASNRLEQHMAGSEWAASIETVKIKCYSTRQEALAAEKQAIKDERPIWNKIHNIRRAVEQLQAKKPEAIYPTEPGEILVFNGSWTWQDGQITNDATGMPMHRSQAEVRIGSIGVGGRVTYFD